MGVTLCTRLQGGRWQDLLGKHLTPKEKYHLDEMPTNTLLSVPALYAAVKIKTRVLSLVSKIKPILPEINFDGKRRCMMVDNGVRCSNYSPGGICMNHAVKVHGITSHFKSQDMREAYEKFRRDPKRLALDGELAMLRLMLVQVTNLTTNLATGQMGMQGIQAATVLCDKIRQMIESISSINKLTPEHIDNILSKAIEISSEYIDPTKLVEFATRIKELMQLEPEPDLPIDEGTKIEVNGEIKEVIVERGESIETLVKQIATDANVPQHIRAMIEQHGQLATLDELRQIRDQYCGK